MVNISYLQNNPVNGEKVRISESYAENADISKIIKGLRK